MEKTYTFVQVDGNAVISLTAHDKQEAWEELGEIVQNIFYFRLDDVKDEYGVEFLKHPELFDEENQGNIL